MLPSLAIATDGFQATCNRKPSGAGEISRIPAPEGFLCRLYDFCTCGLARAEYGAAVPALRGSGRRLQNEVVVIFSFVDGFPLHTQAFFPEDFHIPLSPERN